MEIRSMLIADIYQKNIDFDHYITQNDCRTCGFHSREEFLEKLRGGTIGRDCSARLDPQWLKALQIAARPDVIPEVEVLQLPAPGPVGLFPINDPGPDSHVLVSGNSRITIEVLSAVLSTTVSPFWYLIVDTDGHTVDMSLVFKTFTAERILDTLAREEMIKKVLHRTLFIPGLASFLQRQIKNLTGWSVHVGPICAAELPLYFGTDWQIREFLPFLRK